MPEVTVSASKTYRVIIEDNVLKLCGSLIKETCGADRAFIVCGDTVDGLYADTLAQSLDRAGCAVSKFVYPHGESSKNAQTYVRLLNALADSGLDRHGVITALGGGVTGDMAGFAAATYLRGVKYVQIPTTLLAMIDSSVGGKTGIDLDAGKNLAGAFWQPELVVCDYSVLDTLPEEMFRDGMAEAVKYAVLKDRELFKLLEAPRNNLERIITRCVSIKRDFVCADEFDRGERQKLNLGHSVGHAVEKLSNYSVSHGKAVAVGLAVIARAACANGDCDKNTAEEIVNILKNIGLPTKQDFTAEELSEIMLHDKKCAGGLINLIIPREIGRCEIKKLPVSSLSAYVKKGL